MALQGNHRTIGVPDLFSWIVTQKLDGLLVIASRNRERSFCFRRGEVIYALLNDPGQLLGEVLVRELDLDQQTLDEVVEELHEDHYLGQALVQRGIITERDLAECVGRQVRRALREVLRWRDWAFHFQPDCERRTAPEGALNTQSLVIDLARELDEWNQIREILFDLDCVPRRTTESAHTRVPKDWDRSLPTPGKILMEIDGVRTARRLLEESPYPILPLACALARFADEGLIALESVDTPVEEGADCPSLVLPVLPNLSSRSLELVAEAEPSLAELRELVLSDPVLTAKVLRLAALRNRCAEVSDPIDLDRELERIGVVPLKTALLAEATRRLFLAPCRHTWYRRWEHALLTSIAAREIAERVSFGDPELAQIAGLLHDVGIMVLSTVDGDAYRRVVALVHDQGVDQIEAERRVFQTDHCRVGALLADSWGFPQPVKTVIREHHTTLGHPSNDLLAIVRLASELAEASEETLRLDRRQRRLLKQLRGSYADLVDLHHRIRGHERRLEAIGVLV